MLHTSDFIKMKERKEPIVMLTAYDYPSGKICEQSGIDLILIGDSLGMVVYGEPDTLSVTVEDIIRHAKAVRKGAPETFIIADMPYMSYHINLSETKKNAAALIIQGKADAVKIEGGSDTRLEAVKAIVDCEIPVVGHVGLTPQSIHLFGGFKVQGKQLSARERILQQAIDLEKAGVFMLVLEGMPEALAKQISESVKIPTIGIGAGRYTDGQVLVWHDILGLSGFTAKFSKQYENSSVIMQKAVDNYRHEIKNLIFPAEENIYYPIHQEEV